MTFTRRIIHYSPGPADNPVEIAERAVSGAWFELHRQGGCGAGELRLKDDFADRNAIDLGDWIAFDHSTGERWYLGRVESRSARSPAGTSYRLEGMSVELGEVFPGGFNRLVGDGVPPHRYARTDLFPNDPDRFDETFDSVDEPSDLVRLLIQQYVVPRTNILYDAGEVEVPLDAADLTSLKFNGEESIRSILKDLALRAGGASWGVDPEGTFYFLRPPSTTSITYREGVDLVSLEETRDREFLFNRLLLTGGYVYDATANSEVTARGFFRWRGHYIQPASRDRHGERRIRIWVPWIRTRSDSEAFAREFFRIYAEPTSRYRVEVAAQSSIPIPWETKVRLLDRDGIELISRPVESVRVQFDRTPRVTLEIGPEDPHTHWPEPDQDERWEIPGEMSPTHGGGLITFPPPESSSSETSSGGSTYPPSDIPYTWSSFSEESDASEESDESGTDGSHDSSSSIDSASSGEEPNSQSEDSDSGGDEGSDSGNSSDGATGETSGDPESSEEYGSESDFESSASSSSFLSDDSSSDDPWGFSS